MLYILLEFQVVELAVDHELPMYDAAYISLALAEKETLITADEKLERKLPVKLKSIVKSLSAF